MNHTHGDAAHCQVVCLFLVYVPVCLRYFINLRSCSDLWVSFVCGVRACVRAVGMRVYLGAVQFFAFEPAAPPSHPLRRERFLLPFRASVTLPHGDAAHCRVVCLLLVYMLVCLIYLLNQLLTIKACCL